MSLPTKIKGLKISSIISFLLFAFSIAALIKLSFLNPPPTSLFFTYQSQPYTGGVTLDGFSLKVIIFLLAQYILIALFGYSLSFAFFLETKVSNLVKLISSFFIGFTCLLGIIRILSILLPYEQIYWPTMAVMLLLTFVLFKNQRPDWKNLATTTMRSYKGIFLTIIFTAMFVSFLLISQIYQHGMLWVGHGPDQYSTLLNTYRQEHLLHFPIILQHYDELIFHYFLTMPLKPEFSPILVWWITLALIKVSFLLFIYATFRKIGTSFLSSSIFSLFMMLGTTSLVITRLYVIPDATNPITHVVHSGRIVGIGLAIMLIIESIYYHNQNNRRLPKIFFLLSGLGLAATSVSNILWVILLYSMAVGYSAFFSRDGFKESTKRLFWGTLVCYTAITVSLLFYAMPFQGEKFYKIRSLAILFLLGLLLIKILPELYQALTHLKDESSKRLRTLWLQASIFVLSGCGGLLIGNVFAENKISKIIIEKLGNIFGKITVISTTPYNVRGTTALSVGDLRQTGEAYSTGLAQFSAAFGGIFAIILAAMYLRTKARRKGILGATPENTLYEILVICSVSIACTLFAMDFISIHSYGWLLSRFIEVPLYIILLALFYSIDKFCNRPLKFAFGLLLLAYIIVPFIANHRGDQIMANWRLFTSLLHK